MNDTDRGKKLASVNLKFRTFTLYEHALKTPDGEYAMTPEVRATVDDQTGRAFAPVKLLALGVLGASKKTGALHLTIEGPDFFVTRPAPAGMAASLARKFAGKVNQQAKRLGVS